MRPRKGHTPKLVQHWAYKRPTWKRLALRGEACDMSSQNRLSFNKNSPEVPIFHFLTDGREKGRIRHFCKKKGRIRRFLFERGNIRFFPSSCVSIFVCFCVYVNVMTCLYVNVMTFFSDQTTVLVEPHQKLLHQSTREHRHVYCLCPNRSQTRRRSS